MWTLRAAVRPGSRLFRVVRGCGAPRGAPPLPPCPERALAAFRGGLGSPEGRGGGGRGPRADGRRSRTGGKEDEEEPEDAEEEDELLRRDPLLPAGTQRVCLVHPDVKWGPGKPQGTRAEWQVVEAQALVHTLDGWSVVGTMVVPSKTPDRKLIFGRGTLERLTERIRGSPEITAVFLNVERMAAATKKELEAAWGVQVFDRFTVVLHVFRCHARTKEARLQVALAELPLLRSHLKSDVAHLGGRGGDSRHIMGSGESFLQVQQRLLKDKEVKIRKALDRLRRKRLLLGQQRRRREFPVVAVVGYTNCGKTTLIKALTGDATIQPRDQLFATLDVTAHAGRLPSQVTVIYMDTIGFLSQLPHSLVESFSATMEDVSHSDLIVHVRDVSHPETELQKASVLSALRALRPPRPLLDRVVEVANKVDLVPGYRPAEPGAVAVSALLGLGLEALKARLDGAVLRAAGRRVLTLRVGLTGPQLSWLHQEATVQAVDVRPEAGVADVKVIISDSAYGRFRKLFPG
ncbi:putative GTP-binding protein 6 isoform X2 [Physeter macrocephalus]|uniref:Putative GTP-binding protein 6 n=1 Tax=Physeter macrocephalus TaxID=9755 RepID=A0A2Y9RY66_PHYMC|nr:putative GTP-binding protein 6 isoform X2 [Physeter catodon]|eukprot:XP_023971253.1 serine/threonine-protein phosphatase 2A regulatory subunit B'' subunit beta isoform X8 [Physeter catodon]